MDFREKEEQGKERKKVICRLNEEGRLKEQEDKRKEGIEAQEE